LQSLELVHTKPSLPGENQQPASPKDKLVTKTISAINCAYWIHLIEFILGVQPR
jgi:hypothetical protein